MICPFADATLPARLRRGLSNRRPMWIEQRLHPRTPVLDLPPSLRAGLRFLPFAQRPYLNRPCRAATRIPDHLPSRSPQYSTTSPPQPAAPIRPLRNLMRMPNPKPRSKGAAHPCPTTSASNVNLRHRNRRRRASRDHSVACETTLDLQNLRHRPSKLRPQRLAHAYVCNPQQPHHRRRPRPSGTARAQLRILRHPLRCPRATRTQSTIWNNSPATRHTHVFASPAAAARLDNTAHTR